MDRNHANRNRPPVHVLLYDQPLSHININAAEPSLTLANP